VSIGYIRAFYHIIAEFHAEKLIRPSNKFENYSATICKPVGIEL
ncbi:unnamed protein product, partial [Heterotrigona itama]